MSAARRGNRVAVLRLVHSVRRGWRLGVGLKGLTYVVGITGLVLFFSAMGLEQLRFSPEAVFWLRILTWSTFGVTTLVFFVRPLTRRVSDEQVALYLEEHEPSLDQAVVSALDADHVAEVSPALSRRLVARARAPHAGAVEATIPSSRRPMPHRGGLLILGVIISPRSPPPY